MKTLKSFWNASHSNKTLSDLSGCQYEETVSFLKISPFIIAGNYVLEVGVGLGYVTKGLYENGLFVSGLDISEVALERVKDYCEQLFTTDELEKLPSNYFDCIMCHNVIQHVPTDLLIEELKHCIRSLKTSGVFAVEFVSTDTVDDTWAVGYEYAWGLPGFCRTPKYLEKLIGGVGGKCEMVVNNKCNIGDVRGCHVFHVRKN